MTPTSTRPMDRWECALWTDDSPIHFPLLPGQNHLCGISTHRLLVKSGSFPLSSMDCGLELVELDLRNSSRALQIGLVITVYWLAMLFLKYDNWAEDFPSDHPFYLQQDNARMKGAQTIIWLPPCLTGGSEPDFTSSLCVEMPHR